MERFVVMEVWADGSPHDLAAKESLTDALELRDVLRKERPRGRTGPVFLVYDCDDPERGYLNYEDIYEEANAPCS